MKKALLMSLMLTLTLGYASAQKKAQIKFDKMTYDFGTFSESTPVQKCTFTFTNVGDEPLIINQAMASCGCTVPEADLVCWNMPNLSYELQQITESDIPEEFFRFDRRMNKNCNGHD